MVGHVPATVVPLERPEGVLFGAFHAGATAPDVTGFSQLSSKAPSTMLWYAGFTRSFEENPQPILDDLDEAVAIAKQCPVLEYGSTVEVRPVAEECPTFQRVKEQLAGAVA